MPRKPRFYILGVPAHIVQRGRSREPVFFEDDDYRAYLGWLVEASERYGCALHAYALMTNHIHILATPEKKQSLSLMMQYIGRHYVPYINYTYGTSGSIWEGRYKSSLIQDDQYLLTCMRYIELNPVRADMVNTPSMYQWSSYRSNAQGKHDIAVTQHPLYKKLGRNSMERMQAYKALFKAHIDQVEHDKIQKAYQTGTPLGNDYFREKIEQKLKCKVGQDRRGRPSKRALTP
jgi:putative transposase